MFMGPWSDRSEHIIKFMSYVNAFFDKNVIESDCLSPYFICLVDLMTHRKSYD